MERSIIAESEGRCDEREGAVFNIAVLSSLFSHEGKENEVKSYKGDFECVTEDFNFKSEHQIKYYIKKLFYKLIRIKVDSCYLFYTKNIKGYNKIIKIEINRSGINYCYNKNGKIVSVIFRFLMKNIILKCFIRRQLNHPLNLCFQKIHQNYYENKFFI